MEGETSDLRDVYRAYIACLNHQDWNGLEWFVDDAVTHNGRALGLAGYRQMLIDDFAQIPDLFFNIDLLVCEPPLVAARLRFDVTPTGEFLGLPVNGRWVSFTENVIYRFEDGRIAEVWSVVDKGAIEAQLS